MRDKHVFKQQWQLVVTPAVSFNQLVHSQTANCVASVLMLFTFVCEKYLNFVKHAML